MTPETAAALRCPVCGGPLLLTGRSLRCPKAHSFDLAKEGYAYLLPMQKKHTTDPGDGKAMVRARRAFLSAGHYAPLMVTLAEVCAALPHDHIVDAGCGEGSYDKYLYETLGAPQIVDGADWRGHPELDVLGVRRPILGMALFAALFGQRVLDVAQIGTELHGQARFLADLAHGGMPV